MAIVSVEVLKQYIQADLNVLFIGERGVGKTALAVSAFEKCNLNYKYFGASTLDPWVDLIGTPSKNEKEAVPFLELVRPEFIIKEKIEAIFFDELNRAPEKVLNAVMELIQFKSINGFKLPHLKVVWAAINPETEDHTYSVNHLDPAHIDRFHVHINVPYELDVNYFRKRFPESVAQKLVDWWRAMPIEIRREVSPRRLEYVGDAACRGMNLEHFLPAASNPGKLRAELKNAPFYSKIAAAQVSEGAAKCFINDSKMNVDALVEKYKARDAAAVTFWNKYKNLLPEELVNAVENTQSTTAIGTPKPRKSVPVININQKYGMDDVIAVTSKSSNIDQAINVTAMQLTTLDNRKEAFNSVNMANFNGSDDALLKFVESRKGNKNYIEVMKGIIKLMEQSNSTTLKYLMTSEDSTPTLTLRLMRISMRFASNNHTTMGVVNGSFIGTRLKRLEVVEDPDKFFYKFMF